MARGAWRRAVAFADRYDARHGHRPASPLVAAAAIVRFGAVLVAAPLVVPVVAWRARRSTRAVAPVVDGYASEIEALCSPGPRPPSVGVLAASGRVVVTSDLHRSVAGGSDWPTAQGTASLYEAVLTHYAAGEWTLVENGDVEEFWLVGGSAYGVVYDLARLASRVGGLFGLESRRQWRTAVYREHLRRVLANHLPIYRLIEEGFHRHGRYHRVVGNHDDVLTEPTVAEVLCRFHAGLVLRDALVLLDDDGRGIGVITHGHQPDGWNASGHATLGRLASWFASVVADLPGVQPPGRPRRAWSVRLLRGSAPNELTTVNRVFGVNGSHDSVDEERLARGFREVFGDDPPWLILGHTHIPLLHPWSVASSRSWPCYVNAGSAVSWEVVTAVEWDGTDPSGPPQVRLVAWRFGDVEELVGCPGAVVAEVDGRPLVRAELRPGPSGRTLEAVPATPVERGTVGP